MVSCRFIAKAIFSFVPTPSTDETSTGSRYFLTSSANRPPKPPTLPSTSRRCVEASNCGSVDLTLLPKSISTPAAAYAFCFMRGNDNLIRSHQSLRFERHDCCRGLLQTLGCG